MKNLGTRLIITERLRLCRLRAEDAEYVYERWASDDDVTRYLSWRPHESVEATRKWLGGVVKNYRHADVYDWAIVLKGQKGPIGTLGLTSVNRVLGVGYLGWCLSEKYWGRGIMPEAATAVLAFLFDKVQLNRVYAKHVVQNAKSGRVMKKIGMTQMDTVWKNCDIKGDGVKYDEYMWVITREKFDAKRKTDTAAALEKAVKAEPKDVEAVDVTDAAAKTSGRQKRRKYVKKAVRSVGKK